MLRLIAQTIIAASSLVFWSSEAMAQASELSVERTLKGSEVVARAALGLVGTRYRFGGASVDEGFDCSGLVSHVLQSIGVKAPRHSALQAKLGEPVVPDVSNLLLGDILTFGYRSQVSHVGIYIGEGKFVHAASVPRRVVISRLDRRPVRGVKPWIGVRRLSG